MECSFEMTAIVTVLQHPLNKTLNCRRKIAGSECRIQNAKWVFVVYFVQGMGALHAVLVKIILVNMLTSFSITNGKAEIVQKGNYTNRGLSAFRC